MAPSPELFHQDIILNLAVILRGYLERHRIGSVHIAPSDVQLSELNVYQPDLYFVSNSRKSVLTAHGVEGAPDLVIEVLSPKTAKLDKGMKRSVYARTGVQELWIVDPDRKEVQVYRLEESADIPAVVCRGRQKIESPLLPGLRIPVAKVFKR